MKVLSIIICVALLINAILFLPMTIGSSVDAGAGDGMNTKIVKPEAVGDLMRAISHDFNMALESPSSGPSVVNYGGSNITIEGAEKKAMEVDSVTVHEVANMSTSSTTYYAGEYYSTKYLLKREMTMYITENTTYYHSIGHLDSSSVASETSSASIFDFDMEFYLDVEKEQALMKINRWKMVGNKTVNFSEEIMGKWIAFSGEGMSIIMSVNSMNNSAFGDMGDIVDQAVEENKFQQANKVYRLSKNELADLLGASEDVTLSKADFTVDLSNSEKPLVSMIMGMNNSSDDSYGDYSMTAAVYADVRYEFSNINNTVVSMSRGVEILEIDDEELEAYVIINE